MSRILLAWELGANYGHLTRLALIADHLRAAGHQLLFGVRDTRGAAEVLGAKGFAFAQAPVLQRRLRPRALPANYAELLALEGYAEPASLWGLVRGWISLARLFRADLMVADHSPSALLAGRILGLRQVQVGNGFDNPPQRSPLPSIRPWENIPQARLQRSEQRVTELINGVIRSLRGKELERLADLFDVEARVFATFAELDPFGPRPGERYVGSIHDAGFGDRAVWPNGERRRIDAYLRPSVPGAAHILKALNAADAATLCYMPGVRAEAIRTLSSERLQIMTRPLHPGCVLPEADLALIYGGHGVVSTALIAGVPLLMAPQNVEQYLHARRLESLGIGITLQNDSSVASVAAHIKQALASDGLKAKARAFSAAHAGFGPAQAAEQTAHIIHAVAGQQRPVEAPAPGGAAVRATGEGAAPAQVPRKGSGPSRDRRHARRR